MEVKEDLRLITFVRFFHFSLSPLEDCRYLERARYHPFHTLHHQRPLATHSQKMEEAEVFTLMISRKEHRKPADKMTSGILWWSTSSVFILFLCSLSHCLSAAKAAGGLAYDGGFSSERKLEDTVIVDPLDILILTEIEVASDDGMVSERDIHALEQALVEAYDCPNSYYIDSIATSTGIPCSRRNKWRKWASGSNSDECYYDTGVGKVSWMFSLKAYSTEASAFGSMFQDESSQVVLDEAPCPRLPTASELATKWTEVLADKETGKSVQSISKIVEMKSQDGCDSLPTETITADIVLEAVGLIPDEMTEAQQRVLERAAVQIYNKLNGLNFDTCDPLFRVVDEAEFIRVTDELVTDIPGGSGRRRRNEDLILNPRFLVLRLTGRCLGCSSGRPLFDQFQQRALSTSIDHSSRRLAPYLPDTFTEGCFCPVDMFHTGGPSEEDFYEAWKRALPQLGRDAAFIDELVDVREESCIRDEKFTTNLTLVITGDPGVVQGLDSVLEEVLVESYNSNAAAVCDSQGRALESASLLSSPTTDRRRNNLRHLRVMDIDRVLEEEDALLGNETNYTLSNYTEFPSSAPTAAPSSAPTLRGPNLFALVFQITGVCNGCASELNLFNDITFLRFLEDASSLPPHGLCKCIDESLEVGVQKLDDFVEKINDQLIRREIPIEVAGVEDFDVFPLASPTTATVPSHDPSSGPSNEPSTFPSSRPSADPSVAPSSTPSSLPSFFPSSLPSSSPSASPSTSPSDLPSDGPTSSPTEYFCDYPENSYVLERVQGECPSGPEGDLVSKCIATDVPLNNGSIVKAGVGNPFDPNDERLIVEGRCRGEAGRFFVGDAVFEPSLDEDGDPFSHMGVRFRCSELTYISVYEGCPTRGDLTCIGASTAARDVEPGDLCSDLPSNERGLRWFTFPIDRNVRRYYLKFYYIPPPPTLAPTMAPTPRPTPRPTGFCDSSYDSNGKDLEIDLASGQNPVSLGPHVFDVVKFTQYSSDSLSCPLQVLNRVPILFEQEHSLTISGLQFSYSPRFPGIVMSFHCECFSILHVFTAENDDYLGSATCSSSCAGEAKFLLPQRTSVKGFVSRYTFKLAKK